MGGSVARKPGGIKPLDHVTSRREVITTGAGLLTAASLPGLLAACADRRPWRPVPRPRYTQIGLKDLFLDDGSGFPLLYLDAIGGLPRTRPNAAGLPLANFAVTSLPTELAWMLAYDFNGNGVVDPGEMTQAWLLRAAEIKTGKQYRPDALMTAPRTASLLAQSSLMARLKRVRGLSISTMEEPGIRALLDATAAGKALTTIAAREIGKSAGKGVVSDEHEGEGEGEGEGDESSCFAAGTEVWMADGSFRTIEDIRIGDVVLGAEGINRVIGVETPRLGSRSLYGINEGVPFVTAEHPLMTAEGWKSIDPVATFVENPALRDEMAGPLRPGDRLLTGGRATRGNLALAPEHVAVETIVAARDAPDTLVYNLLLDGSHDYWVAEGKKKIPGPQQGTRRQRRLAATPSTSSTTRSQTGLVAKPTDKTGVPS